MRTVWFLSYSLKPRRRHPGIDVVWSGTPGEEPWRFVRAHRKSAYDLASSHFTDNWVSADEHARAVRAIIRSWSPA